MLYRIGKHRVEIEQYRKRLADILDTGEHTPMLKLAKELKLPTTELNSSKLATVPVLYDRVDGNLIQKEAAIQTEIVNRTAFCAAVAAIASAVSSLVVIFWK